MRTVKIVGLVVAVLGLLTAVIALLTEGVKLVRELPSQSSQPPAAIATESNTIPTSSSSNISNNPPDEFFNEWVNIDSQSGSLTRVSIQSKDGGAYINMFGSCSPTDCNFREDNPPAPTVNYNYDSGTGILHVEWIMNFAVLTQQLTLSNGQLKVAAHTHFTDNSGRADYDSVDYFTSSASNSVSNNPPVVFFNEWVNVDTQSGSITKASIQAKDGGTYINMFGACSPTDCNFREYSPAPTVNYNYNPETKILYVEWVFDFEVMSQKLSITLDNQLKVETHHHFVDNSGRVDSDFVDYFTRQ